MSNDFLFVEKYRPKKIEDCILPESLKKTFTEIIKKDELPNMLFSGSAGLGKTTVAKALCDELGYDWLMINGSEDGGIDTLRNKIRRFASTISLEGGLKVVILDEADYLTQHTQPALRAFIEEFSNNCRFILTCNFKNRIIEALHSRCSVYEFNINGKERAQLMQSFYKRLVDILHKEDIKYDNKVILELITRHAPDWRRVLNEVQRFSISGELSIDVLNALSSDEYGKLFDYLKTKDFKKMRTWVTRNIDVDSHAIFRAIYDRMYDKVDAGSIPQLVLILADYQYKAAFAADNELNTVACMTELMGKINFK